jgi:hypothetical protein
LITAALPYSGVQNGTMPFGQNEISCVTGCVQMRVQSSRFQQHGKIHNSHVKIVGKFTDDTKKIHLKNKIVFLQIHLHIILQVVTTIESQCPSVYSYQIHIGLMEWTH